MQAPRQLPSRAPVPYESYRASVTIPWWPASRDDQWRRKWRRKDPHQPRRPRADDRTTAWLLPPSADDAAWRLQRAPPLRPLDRRAWKAFAASYRASPAAFREDSAQYLCN